ncbi:hypothetical protein [Neorhizobium alkalisoli]|uniref:hypothetical protein n=1 Tax=Neorhizobium alkalisoli TaxID=528178 RepID=UPI000CFA5A80|nr:hypothetical protein [Neorhizobium alkalisoli]
MASFWVGNSLNASSDRSIEDSKSPALRELRRKVSPRGPWPIIREALDALVAVGLTGMQAGFPNALHKLSAFMNATTALNAQNISDSYKCLKNKRFENNVFLLLFHIVTMPLKTGTALASLNLHRSMAIGADRRGISA